MYPRSRLCSAELSHTFVDVSAQAAGAVGAAHILVMPRLSEPRHGKEDT
jgi:hypothetical protein